MCVFVWHVITRKRLKTKLRIKISDNVDDDVRLIAFVVITFIYGSSVVVIGKALLLLLPSHMSIFTLA